MAESVKDIALRIKHDGVVYGLDAGALVKTAGEQTIDGKKTFKVLPQSAANPVEPTDFATKSYVDSLQGGVAKAYSATLKMRKDNTDWFGFTRFKILLADGTRLDISQVQNDVDTSTYAKPMATVFKVVKDLNAVVAAPAKKTAQQIEEYELQEGEFKGTIEYVKALTSSLSISSNRGFYQPWEVYCISGNVKTLSPVYKVTVSGLKCHMLGVAFEMGEAVSGSYDYHCDGCAVDFAMDDKLISVDYSGPLDNATKINIEIPSDYIKEYVDTSSAQSIRGVKTFASLPKSNATPTDEDDFVTKKYLDEQVNPSTDVSVTITAETSRYENNWCGVSNVQLFLAKDVQLFPLKMEEGTLANLKEPKLMIFTTEKQSSPAPTKVSKQEILDYKLRPGDYRGLFYTADLLGKNTVHSSESWQDPFTKGQGYLTWGDVFNVPEPQIKLVVQNLGQIVAKVGVSESSYAAQNITASSTIRDVTEEGTKTTGTNTNNFAFGDKLSGVFKNAVLTVGDQEINGVKTFALSPKSNAEAVEDNDLVTKGFADANYLAMPAPSTTEIDITCEGSGYAAFSELKILVGEDKVIEPVCLEKRESTPDAKPYRFVYKVSDLGSYQVKQTTRKTGTELDKYVLQDGEHWGVLSYSVAFNEQNGMNSYDVQTDPWWGYLFSSREKAKHIMARLHFEDLPLSLKGVQYKSGDKYNSFGYKADKYGAKFTCGKKSQEFELIPAAADHEFLADSSALEPDVTQSFFVELKGNQTVSGVKTFNSVPVTNGYPTAPNELITKEYATNTFMPMPPCEVEMRIGLTAGSGAWSGFSHLNILLANGKRLEAKFIEDAIHHDATPVKVVLQTTNNPQEQVPIPVRKEKGFFDSYQLAQGEYWAEMTFANGLGGNANSHTSAIQACPWDAYLVNNLGLGNKGDIVKIVIHGINVAISHVQITAGDRNNSYAYLPTKYFLTIGTNGNMAPEMENKDSITAKAIIDFDISSLGLAFGEGTFVKTTGDQTIQGTKTFGQKVFITDESQSAEMMAGQVATTESLKAVGLIGANLNKAQLIVLWGAYPTKFYDPKNATELRFYYGHPAGLRLFAGSRELFLKYTEAFPDRSKVDGNVSPSTKWLRCVLSTTKEWDTASSSFPEKDSGFLDSYQLQPGEFFGASLYCNRFFSYSNSGGSDAAMPDFWEMALGFSTSKNQHKDMRIGLPSGTGTTKTYTTPAIYGAMVIYAGPTIDGLEISCRPNDDPGAYSPNVFNVYSEIKDSKINADEITFPTLENLDATYGGKSTKGHFDPAIKTGVYDSTKPFKSLALSVSAERGESSIDLSSPLTYLSALTVENSQRVNGLKTFIQLPQSAATPADEKDLITKKFLDAEIAKLVARIEALESPKP